MSLLCMDDDVFEIKRKPIIRKKMTVKTSIAAINRMKFVKGSLEALKNQSVHNSIQNNQNQNIIKSELPEEKVPMIEVTKYDELLKSFQQINSKLENAERDNQRLKQELETQYVNIRDMINGIQAKEYSDIDNTIQNLKSILIASKINENTYSFTSPPIYDKISTRVDLPQLDWNNSNGMAGNRTKKKGMNFIQLEESDELFNQLAGGSFRNAELELQSVESETIGPKRGRNFKQEELGIKSEETQTYQEDDYKDEQSQNIVQSLFSSNSKSTE